MEVLIQPAMWHADVDYLRLTHRKGSGFEVAYGLYIMASEKIAGDLILPAYTWSDWQWRGYRGKQLGPIAYGERDDGAILQVSGGAAADAVRMKLPHTACPRIDLQATYWLGADFRSLAWHIAAMTDKARIVGPKPLWKARLVDGRGDGDTIYIGRRGGESKFLRCYDKWRQQGYSDEYKYAWRFEAELTDGHGQYAHDAVINSDMAPYTVLAILSGYWAERGVELPEVRPGHGYTPARIKRPPESMERTVRWLSEQVRPALEKAYGRGLTEGQVRSILGL